MSLVAATLTAFEGAPLPDALRRAAVQLLVSGARRNLVGAPANASVVTLQARKPTSLIVRGADGSVYFARQLAAGEAYRAPTLKGVTADVVEAGAVQAFVAGQSRGLLPVGLNSVTKLAATAPPPPVPVAAAVAPAPTVPTAPR